MMVETCNLLQANKPDGTILKPEQLYKNLVCPKVPPNKFFKNKRADLVFFKSSILADQPQNDSNNISKHVDFVVEVKRLSAPMREIKQDLWRLYMLLTESSPDVRAYQIIVQEARSDRQSQNNSKMFIENGKAKRGIFQSSDKTRMPHTVHYSVRRVLKASASFDKKESSHYVIIVEVLR